MNTPTTLENNFDIYYADRDFTLAYNLYHNTYSAAPNLVPLEDLPHRSNGTHKNDHMHGSIQPDFMTGGAGNDILAGGTGNDTLEGGSGIDHFGFQLHATPNGPDGSGKDRIVDFTEEDYIRIFDNNAGVDSIHDIGIKQIGNDTRIWFSSDDWVTLVGVDRNTIDESDFIFG